MCDTETSAKPLAEILHNSDGSITFQYKPVDIGTHELNAIFNDQGVIGTPFRCHVDKVESSFIIAYGSGLVGGSIGKQCDFEVIGGAESDLDITISGPVSPTVNRETVDFVTKVHYLPLSAGEFTVSILYKEKHIHGSPFTVKITGEGRKKSKLVISATSEVSLGVPAIDLANVIGVLKTPSGDKEPCLLVPMRDAKLGLANFVPHTRGMYEIEVTREDDPLPGSPFHIPVGEEELCNASKVKIIGDTKEVTCNDWNILQFDLTSAGYGALAISVDGAYRTDLQYTDKEHHLYELQYRPQEPGIYVMNVLFGDDHITGSPFILNVDGEPSGRLNEIVTKEIAAVAAAHPGSKCVVRFKIPGTSCIDMEAIFVSPSGNSDACEIVGLDDCVHEVRFEPEEEGVYTISLKHKGLHVCGSPFQYTVGKIPTGGSHKVQCGGPGLEKGETCLNNEFNIYTREAGAGTLSIGVEGPSQPDVILKEQDDCYMIASYNVSEAGVYQVGVKWNNEHVRGSPFAVKVTAQNRQAKLVTVQGLRDRGTEVGKPITFNAYLNGAKGTLASKVKTPTGQVKDVAVQEMDRDLYALRFLPTENGVHFVSVTLSDADIIGSPFSLLVGKLGADPGLVHIKGDGLAKAETGTIAKFKVVTVNSGAGPLAVSIDGPSRVAIMCIEDAEGYEFVYTPTVPGDYYISLKYCNITIAGCPFKAVVTGRGRKSDYTQTSTLCIEAVEKKPGQSKIKRFTGDASKVQVAGPGLKKAFMNKPSNFTIDVKNAGCAPLAIGIISPTGQLVEELGYKLQKATIYQVNYKTKEKGDYVMHVTWGSEEVPGSPFIINSG